ncbi:cytochrome P450 71D11-like [Hibiscus syriacus]|uniref:Cytochrome P450 71D11-like n=1 Tax=Hibiscus syriacus TaxID=106335 RepID=A0A6A3CYT9_HIBSY|nr:cytochrome P450 71D11-like [Hibiscus syriacus]
MSTWHGSGREAAKEVLNTHDIKFANRPYLLAAEIILYDGSDIAFAPYGASWRQLRKFCTLELLSKQRVQSFRPIREKEKVTQLGSGFSIVDMFPSVKLLHVITGMRAKLERLHHDLDAMLESIIEEHRAYNARSKKTDDEIDDLVDVLLNLQDHGGIEAPLTKDNIKAVILELLLDGTESSSVIIEWAMSEIIKNPTILKKAQTEVRQVYDRAGNVDESKLDELKYFKLVVKETLRLHPPGPLLLPRENNEKCEINGYEIPAKTKVIVNAWKIARDPKYWDEAERFNPERFINSLVDYKGTNFEYIPFGAGRRICPGMSYGMVIVELCLAQLFHFDWELPNGIKNEDLDMSESFGVSFRRKTNLHLIPIPYSPPSVH